MHDLDSHDPAAHLEILTGPERVGFATVYRGDEPVGIGRVSVEGEWAGVTSVDVPDRARRQGAGSAVMRALLEWAGRRGAVASYLQVRAGNAAALRLYAALGYVTHHAYTYRAPTTGEGRRRPGPRSEPGSEAPLPSEAAPLPGRIAVCRPGRLRSSPPRQLAAGSSVLLAAGQLAAGSSDGEGDGEGEGFGFGGPLLPHRTSFSGL
jgi:GNAT superfamily N-acetyltransferase